MGVAVFDLRNDIEERNRVYDQSDELQGITALTTM